MIINKLELNLILIFIFIGLISSMVYGVFGLIKIITKRNVLVVNIIDFFYVMICGFVFLQAIFTFKNGSFALFDLFLFAFGIVFGEIIVKNLFTSPIKWVYNKIRFIKAKRSFIKINNNRGN